MATVIRCVECPEREFDNAGSARGHANRMKHHTVELDEALVAPLEEVADEVAPVTAPVTMTKYPALTGELGEQLDTLATRIRENYERGQAAVTMAWESRFVIAEALATARQLLRSDVEYGRWIKEQNFPFSRTRANEFKQLGEVLPAARALVDTSAEENPDQEIGLRKVLHTVAPRQAKPKPRPETDDEDEEDDSDLLAEPVLHGFLYGKATELFAGVPLTAEYWGQIDPDNRRAAAKEFKLLIDRMVAINDLWKESDG